jgi:hypothetical protein
MSTPRPSFRHAAALALLALFATLGIAPGCSLIEGQKDCEAACSELNRCGLFDVGSCGGYCTGMVAGVAIAGCDDEFDAQNECAKDSTDCSTGASKCVKQVEAFSKCMETYCAKNPTGQGCPG